MESALLKTETDQSGIIRQCRPRQVLGSTILKITSSVSFVYEDEMIKDLSAALLTVDSVNSLAVLARDGSFKGIITRQKLYELMGRAYGREVYGKKNVGAITEKARTFTVNDTVFTVAESLDEALSADFIEYFGIVDFDGTFSGLFSSRDILYYLADMTRQDIHLARQLHERLIRDKLSVSKKGMEIEGFSRSAGILGGDFYYIDHRHPKRWFLTLCDVSGKGVAASIITSLLWGMVTMLDPDVGLAKFIRKLNHRIISTFHLEKYLTGVFLHLHPDTGNTLICDMGHSLAFLIRDGKFRKFKHREGNMPVGIVPEIEPKISKFTMKRGDILLLLSDGLIEQVDQRGEEFSFKRLVPIIENSAGEPLKVICERVLDFFQRYRKGVPQHDDVTFLLIRRV
jgi:sigma-B regulation protein RsbU (phosphoserine phosphatase)